MSGKFQLYGLVGQGISYSLSPRLHNAAFKYMGIEAQYELYDTKAGCFEDQIKKLQDLDIQGLNITQPFKTLAGKLMTNPGPQSVNTLKKSPQGFSGTSTDGQGFLRGLERYSIAIKDFDHALILGSGGAARALIDSLQELRPSLTIEVFSRRCFQKGDEIRWAPLDLSHLSAALRKYEGSKRVLLIHATSAPGLGESLSYLVPALRLLGGSFVDLNYGTHLSALAFAARELKIPCLDGIPMLIEQARLSQEYWLGQSAPYAYLAKCLGV